MGVIKQDNFDLNKLKIKEVSGVKFKKMPFVYEGIPPVIEIEGWFSLYKNWFDGRKSYSVGTDVNEGFDFKGLESRMIKLSSEEFPKESLKLIKKNKKGNEVICCKAATDLNGKPQKVGCKIAAGKQVMENSRMYVKLVSFMAGARFAYYMHSRVGRVDLHLKRGTLFARLMSEITPLV